MPLMVALKCHQCGAAFERLKKQMKRSEGRPVFCSRTCGYEYVKAHTEMVENICPICGNRKMLRRGDFTKNKGHICCGPECTALRRRRRIRFICETCGKEVEAPASRSDGKYCSWACSAKASRKQIVVLCANCGKEMMRAECLVQRSQQHFCSKACQHEYLKGERSAAWKGGITKELRLLRTGASFREWRNQVFERDAYTCQRCGKLGGHLHPHHIKHFAEFPDLRFEVSNGITLCADCHGKEHGLTYNTVRAVGKDGATRQKTAGVGI